MKGRIYKHHLVYEVENGKWRRSVNRMLATPFSVFDILNLKRINGKVCIA